jgi:hypothetical protein
MLHRARWLRSTIAAIGSLAASTWASPAGADDSKAACTAAYVQNQKLRKDGKLAEAHGALITCAQEGCPKAIKADCVRWLADLEQSIPTLVIDAKGVDGNDTTEVTVYVDGNKLAEGLDGRPLPIDPGAHQLRFEHGDAPPIEQQIVVQEGVKNRRVTVSFEPDAPEPPRDQKEDRAPDGGPAVPWPAVVAVGVVSLAGFGLFAGFGITGQNRYDELDRSCGANAADPALRQSCSEEDVDALRTHLLIADVSLVVGGVAAAVTVGLIVWNVTSDDDSASARVYLGPAPGGARGGVDVRF